ncbi:MAG: molybdenum cofactor biosynthesis protein MoaE [Pseudomonadota bacterium]
MAGLEVLVSRAPLVPASLTERFHGVGAQVGAIATFTGVVRGTDIKALEIEHYPGMTERVIEERMLTAVKTWGLSGAQVIHRIGVLPVGEPIVWVAVSASHRAEAFAACEYLIDFLKVEAPFWKKEHFANGMAGWVDTRDADIERTRRWGPTGPESEGSRNESAATHRSRQECGPSDTARSATTYS